MLLTASTDRSHFITVTIWPTLPHVLINTYREASMLFCDSQTLFSNKGTIQGDPLAMYAIGTHPLLCKLDKVAKQAWYVDNSAAGSSIENLKKWWDLLYEIGPKYGYYPNSSKMHMLQHPLVKHEHHDHATTVFQDKEFTSSQMVVGSVLGNAFFLKLFTKSKLSNWIQQLSTLSSIVETRPHTANSAFTHGTCISAKQEGEGGTV